MDVESERYVGGLVIKQQQQQQEEQEELNNMTDCQIRILMFNVQTIITQLLPLLLQLLYTTIQQLSVSLFVSS